MGGTIWLFQAVPKAFLPVGDSGFIRGVYIAREGSSPQQMREIQDKVAQLIEHDDNILSNFSMIGNSGFVASNQGFVGHFLKDKDQRQPIQTVTANFMRKVGQIPGIFAFFQPNPVLQISTGATQQTQGQYAYALSGVDPVDVRATAVKIPMPAKSVTPGLRRPRSARRQTPRQNC